MASALSWVRRPRFTSLPSSSAICALPLSAAAWSRSISTISRPACTETVAMPAPIRPAPSTPIFVYSCFATPLGRRASLLASCRPKNSVRIMLLATGIAQQRHEVARLDLERRVERQLQALVDARHDRLGRRIDAVGLAGDHRVAADEGLHADRAPHLAAGEARHLEARLVPRLHRARVDRLGALAGIGRHDLSPSTRRHQPRLGARQQLARRHDLVDQADALGGLDRAGPCPRAGSARRSSRRSGAGCAACRRRPAAGRS